MRFITYDVIIESVKKDNGNKYQLSKNNLKKGLDNYNIGSYNKAVKLIKVIVIKSSHRTSLGDQKLIKITS